MIDSKLYNINNKICKLCFKYVFKLTFNKWSIKKLCGSQNCFEEFITLRVQISK